MLRAAVRLIYALEYRNDSAFIYPLSRFPEKSRRRHMKDDAIYSRTASLINATREAHIRW